MKLWIFFYPISRNNATEPTRMKGVSGDGEQNLAYKNLIYEQVELLTDKVDKCPPDEIYARIQVITELILVFSTFK